MLLPGKARSFETLEGFLHDEGHAGFTAKFFADMEPDLLTAWWIEVGVGHIAAEDLKVVEGCVNHAGFAGEFAIHFDVLTALLLAENGLKGTLPSELGDLVSLQNFFFSDNEFSGTIPTEIGNLASLQPFDGSNNQLPGFILMELGRLVSLNLLNLEDNNQGGSIPTELGLLTSSLTIIYVSGNSLTSTEMPSEVCSLSLSGLETDWCTGISDCCSR
eukprot:Nitzschia sp. Nitz4//scaffold116_size91068//75095//75832//NITZ4_004966-RA/size91068-processed-gene-0.34-mRNA-1//1//CDS//3329533602//2167//frame0